MIVYASISNSDDKLSQRKWSNFLEEFIAEITELAMDIHGIWFSSPEYAYQNACVCFELDEGDVAALKDNLKELSATYLQDSIAWAAVQDTEFL